MPQDPILLIRPPRGFQCRYPQPTYPVSAMAPVNLKYGAKQTVMRVSDRLSQVACPTLCSRPCPFPLSLQWQETLVQEQPAGTSMVLLCHGKMWSPVKYHLVKVYTEEPWLADTCFSFFLFILSGLSLPFPRRKGLELPLLLSVSFLPRAVDSWGSAPFLR